MDEAKPLSRDQWLVLAAAFLGWMFDGVEIGLFPLVARPALQELLGTVGDAEVGFWTGVVTAAFLLGAALGGLVFGWLGDRVGRVRAMVLSVLCYSLFTGAGFFATQAWHLAAFRFIASLGMGGEWAVAVALVVECWPERYRPKLAGAIGAASNIGFLMIAIVAFCWPVVSGSWRWMMLVGAAPAVLALLISLFVPESEKWKAAAAKTSRKTPLREVFGPGLRKRTILGIIFSGIPLVGTWAAVSGWTPPWVEQMKQIALVDAELPGLHLADTASSGQDGDMAKVKQGLADAQSQLPPETWTRISHDAARSKAAVQIVIAIGAIIACYIAPLIGGLWGRRPVYFALCLLSLGVCAYMFRCLATFDTWFLGVAGVAGGVTAAFYGWLPLYLPEIFPTRVRATGQGLSYNFGRILAAVGALYMGQLVRVLGGDYARAGANITLIYIAGLLLIWLAPETKGKPLPD